MDSLDRLSCIIRLGRLHMTQFSAITFVASSIAACEIVQCSLDWYAFLTAYAFVFSCQMVAHFLGEYYDQTSDKLNLHGSVLTGGSRVLTTTNLNPKICLYFGWGFSVFSAVWALFVLPNHTVKIAFAMLLIAHQYSAPPLKLNHMGLGEIAAVTVQNILLPTFAVMCQSNQFISPVDNRLHYMIWPSFFIKLSLFIVLNLNDRRPDWLSDKITMPILLGEETCIILHTILNSAAYVFVWNAMPWSIARTLSMMSAPLAFWICLQMWTARPYRYDRLLALSLLHCTSMMWSILIDSLFQRMSRTEHISLALALMITFMILKFISSCKAFFSLSKVNSTTGISRPPIIICGAGIAGLVSAIVLHRLKIPFVVTEKRNEHDSLEGADLALWPSAIQILQALGIRESFWTEHTQSLDEVVMMKLDDGKILNRIDMKAVVSQTSEKFRLVSRKLLMAELKQLIPSESVLYQTKFVAIDACETKGPVNAIFEFCGDRSKQAISMPCRLLIGADGIYSAVRRTTLPNCGISVSYCGEMCYRGVIDFASQTSARIKEAFDSILEGIPDSTMLITYGRGIRASVGYLSSGNPVKGYWWVKTSSKRKEKPEVSTWPHSLRCLYESTTKSEIYAHEIVDSTVSCKRISSWCSVLVGDAAHPITPNMGQGACLAVEDAFVLCTYLGLYSDFVDGDTEACYQYEIMRKHHVASIARSSRFQSKIGQFSHPILVWIRNNIIYKLPKEVFVSKLRANIFDVSHPLQLFHNQVALAEG